MAGVRVQTGLAVLLVLLSPAARAFKLPSLPLSRSISRRIYEVVSRNHGALSSMKVAGASAGVAAVVSANSAAPMPPKGGATTSRSRDAYLLWSPGFRARLAASMAVLCGGLLLAARTPVIRALCANVEEGLRLSLMHHAHRLALWSVLSMLSSSCCLIQLLLNAFSIGCAGLNTYLGPLRPSLLALTLVLTSLSWGNAINSPVFPWKTSVLTTVLALGQSFLPEFLYLFNSARTRAGPRDAGDGEANLVTLGLTGLGCSACMTAVTGVALGHAPLVRRVVSVSIEEGKAVLELAPGSSPEESGFSTLLRDLETRGFPAKVIETSSATVAS